MNGLSKPERAYRWVLRMLGIIGFVTLLTLLVLGREFSAAWIAVVGFLMGGDPLLAWVLRTR